jgi:hypothetical protein
MLNKLLLILVLLDSTISYGKNIQFKLLEPIDVSIDAYKYQQPVYDSYLYPTDRQLNYGSTFNLDFNVVEYKRISLYSLNKLYFDANDTGKVSDSGWQYEIGLNFYHKISLFKQHHSRHIFEDTRLEHFPLYDRYGIRFKIY